MGMREGRTSCDVRADRAVGGGVGDVHEACAAHGAHGGRSGARGVGGAHETCGGVRGLRDARGVDNAHKPDAPHRLALPGAFTMLYESRDGRFCLFEGIDGHLSAVDASKFA